MTVPLTYGANPDSSAAPNRLCIWNDAKRLYARWISTEGFERCGVSNIERSDTSSPQGAQMGGGRSKAAEVPGKSPDVGASAASDDGRQRLTVQLADVPAVNDDVDRREVERLTAPGRI